MYILIMTSNSDTFEDKRRENFEKGQAELERRRKALLDAQRRETEERLRRYVVDICFTDIERLLQMLKKGVIHRFDIFFPFSNL